MLQYAAAAAERFGERVCEVLDLVEVARLFGHLAVAEQADARWVIHRDHFGALEQVDYPFRRLKDFVRGRFFVVEHFR